MVFLYCLVKRAVDEAKRVCSASQQIEASMEITITGDSEIREAQHTLRTQLEEALALERKQRDRSVARVQEREAYCEELEKTSHEVVFRDQIPLNAVFVILVFCHFPAF